MCRFACGGNNDTWPDAPAWYCPVGSGAPIPVGPGNYSTPQAAPRHQRSGQAVCPPGRYCEGGLVVSVDKQRHCDCCCFKLHATCDSSLRLYVKQLWCLCRENICLWWHRGTVAVGLPGGHLWRPSRFVDSKLQRELLPGVRVSRRVHQPHAACVLPWTLLRGRPQAALPCWSLQQCVRHDIQGCVRPLWTGAVQHLACCHNGLRVPALCRKRGQ
jgi:hypothetical protein